MQPGPAPATHNEAVHLCQQLGKVPAEGGHVRHERGPAITPQVGQEALTAGYKLEGNLQPAAGQSTPAMSA
jgi:hypothetical protein